MIEKIRRTFIAGLLIFLPLAITVFIVYWAVMYTENLLKPIFLGTPYYFPGMSVLFLILLIFLLGILGTHAIGQRAIVRLERALRSVPILRTVYTGVKEALKALVESDVERLKGVVLVEYPRKGVYAIGFTSGSRIENAEKESGKRLVNVFIPTSPNPTSGIVVLVPEDEIIYLDIGVEEAMKIIISGGFSGLERKEN